MSTVSSLESLSVGEVQELRPFSPCECRLERPAMYTFYRHEGCEKIMPNIASWMNILDLAIAVNDTFLSFPGARQADTHWFSPAPKCNIRFSSFYPRASASFPFIQRLFLQPDKAFLFTKKIDLCPFPNYGEFLGRSRFELFVPSDWALEVLELAAFCVCEITFSEAEGYKGKKFYSETEFLPITYGRMERLKVGC